MKKLLSVILCAAMLFAAVPFAVSADGPGDNIAGFGCDTANLICMQNSEYDNVWIPDFYITLKDGSRRDVGYNMNYNEDGDLCFDLYVSDDAYRYGIEAVDSPYGLVYNYYMLDPGTYAYTAKLTYNGEQIATCTYTIVVHENFIKSVETRPITVFQEDAVLHSEDEHEWYEYAWDQYIDAVVTTVDGAKIRIDPNRVFEYGGTYYKMWISVQRYGANEIHRDEKNFQAFFITPLNDKANYYYSGKQEISVAEGPKVVQVDIPDNLFFVSDAYEVGYGEYDENTGEWSNHYKEYDVGEGVTVHFADGGTGEAGFYFDEEYGSYLYVHGIEDCCYPVVCDNIQGPGNEWGTGEHVVHYTVCNKNYTQTVEIVDVAEIQIEPVKMYYTGSSYYPYEESVEFTITLTNGDTFRTDDFEKDWNSGTLQYKDRILNYYVYDDIEEWTVGVHKATLSCFGKDFDFDVEIAKLPVVSVTADPVKVIMSDEPAYHDAVYDEKTGKYVKGGTFHSDSVHIVAKLEDGSTLEGDGRIEIGSQVFGFDFGPESPLDTPITTGKYKFDGVLADVHTEVDFEIVSSYYDDHVLYLLQLNGLTAEEEEGRFENGTLVYVGRTFDYDAAERIDELFDLPYGGYFTADFTAACKGKAVEPNGKVKFTYLCDEEFLPNGITVARFENDELVPVVGKFDPVSHKYTFELDKTGVYVFIRNDEPDYMPGDVNGNGKIDAADYAMAKRAFLKTYVVSAEQLMRADINGNGKIDASEYAMIKRHFLGTYTIPGTNR